MFDDDSDRTKFIEILLKAKGKFDYKLFSFCLQNCSYEFIVYDNGSDISKIMKSINISYAMYKKNDTPLFKDRYKSTILTSTENLLEISKNLHCSKVDGIWTSKCSYSELNSKFEELIDSDMLYGVISKNIAMAKEGYNLFIDDNIDYNDLKCEKNSIDLKAEVCIKTKDKAYEKLSTFAKSNNTTVSELLKNKELRNSVIKEIRKHSTLSLKDLGEVFGGISESTVSKILNK